MQIQKQIETKLTAQINCSNLEVINESHLHAGHNDFDGTGESHFRIKIASGDFKDLTRIKIHRKIHEILAEELKTIHALAIVIL